MTVKRAAGLAALAASTVAVAQSSACADISDVLASDPSTLIRAEIAYECLQSVPNKPDPAVDLIESLKAYVQWQSSLAWLKNPPDDYEIGNISPTDLLGNLDDISSKASGGEYASEYDFQLAIYEALFAAHDGHLSYLPDIFIPFVFANDLAYDLVSVSTDGLEVPKLYHYTELTRAARLGSDTMPPAVTEINGEDAATFINNMNLKYSAFQDPDSMWNSQFPNYVTQMVTGTLAASVNYMGANLTFTYDDGSSRVGESYAYVPSVTFDVSSGEEFYQTFCEPAPLTSSRKRADGTFGMAGALLKGKAEKTSAEAFEQFKKHMEAQNIEPMQFKQTAATRVAQGGGGTLNGFFLSGDYSDTAVLSVSAFAPNQGGANAYLADFQSTLEDFLAQCDEEGMERLVIDVTGNGGGLVVAGYELFAQLYPDTEQWGANNIRLHEGSDDVARVMEEVGYNFSPSTDDEATAWQVLFGGVIGANLYPVSVYSPDGEEFSTTDELLGPVNLADDTFTAYQNTPLNDPSWTFNLTGTGDRSDPRPAVFDPANVVILTDGTCGSTCTIFSYLMITQMGVRTTAAGGRPRTGTMQGIAGVEGAQLFPMLDIGQTAEAALMLTSDDSMADGQLGVLSEYLALRRGANTQGGVNGKNSFRMDNAETPFQFLNQPANCRFFYTYEMLEDPELVWNRAVDASFNDPDTWCVEGSQNPVSGAIESADAAFSESQEDPDAANGDGDSGSGDGDDGEGAAAGLAVSWAVMGVVGVSALMGAL